MDDVIENKISKSGLVTLDLEDLMPAWNLVGFNMADVLWEGLALKEKDFRTFVKENEWSQYKGKEVYVFSSADAIIPTWAYMLLSAAISPYANNVIVGNERDMLLHLWRKYLTSIDVDQFKGQRVVLKGCSKSVIPESIYLELTAILSPIVKTLMFGEPCSTVPILKNK